MARLTDESLLAQIKEVLKDWRVSGNITWKPVAAEWVRKNLEGGSTQLLAKLMFEYVSAGGAIDQVEETRADFRSEHKFHYDFRLIVGQHKLYLETVLVEDKMGPYLHVVSIHWA